MSWRMFGQIALLILIYFAFQLGSATIRDYQVAAAIEARAVALRAADAEQARREAQTDREIAAARLAAEPHYDAPPAASDPRAEIMNGIPFRRDAHYRPGSAEARAQADAEVARRQGD